MCIRIYDRIVDLFISLIESVYVYVCVCECIYVCKCLASVRAGCQRVRFLLACACTCAMCLRPSQSVCVHDLSSKSACVFFEAAA
jgi:hypothetical protein